MDNIHFELTSTPLTSHTGLAFVGQALSETKLAHHINSLLSFHGREGLGEVFQRITGFHQIVPKRFDADTIAIKTGVSPGMSLFREII